MPATKAPNSGTTSSATASTVTASMNTIWNAIALPRFTTLNRNRNIAR